MSTRLVCCIGAAALVVTACPPPARAQQAPARGRADSLRLATARSALEAAGTAATMLAVMRAALPAQRAALPDVPALFWSRFEERMVADGSQLVDSIAGLYAELFSQPELDALLAFHRSPAGRRLRELSPRLAQRSSEIGQRWGMRVGEAVGESLKP